MLIKSNLRTALAAAILVPVMGFTGCSGQQEKNSAPSATTSSAVNCKDPNLSQADYLEHCMEQSSEDPASASTDVGDAPSMTGAQEAGMPEAQPNGGKLEWHTPRSAGFIATVDFSKEATSADLSQMRAARKKLGLKPRYVYKFSLINQSGQPMDFKIGPTVVTSKGKQIEALYVTDALDYPSFGTGPASETPEAEELRQLSERVPDTMRAMPGATVHSYAFYEEPITDAALVMTDGIHVPYSDMTHL